jgi:hypothetical protein
MSSLKIKIDNFVSTSALDRLSAYDPKESVAAIVELLNGLRLGNYPETTNVAFQIDKNPVAATGIVTFSGEISAEDNFSVNGVTFTAKAEPAGAVQFLAGVDPKESADSFVEVYNASTNAKLTSITASNVSGVITLTCDEAGVMGNGFKLIKTTGTNLAVTDFTGGTDGTSTDFNV